MKEEIQNYNVFIGKSQKQKQPHPLVQLVYDKTTNLIFLFTLSIDTINVMLVEIQLPEVFTLE